MRTLTSFLICSLLVACGGGDRSPNTRTPGMEGDILQQGDTNIRGQDEVGRTLDNDTIPTSH